MPKNNYNIESNFINTPSRRLIQLREDFAGEGGDIRKIDATLYSLSPDEVKDASVKISLKVWQDNVLPKKEEIEEFYKSAGAAEVKVEIKRIPREVVRSDRVTQLESLADKLDEQAKIKNESMPTGVREIASDLETLSDEEIYEKVKSGYTYGAGSRVSTT